MEAYTTYVAATILVFCLAAFLVLLWSLLTTYRAVKRHRGERTPGATYARWWLFRSCIRASQLFFFLVPVGAYFAFPGEDPLGSFISVTSLLIVALSIAVTELVEPVAQRRVESAIKEEGHGRLQEQVEHTREMVGEMREEQRQVQRDLGTQQDLVRRELGEQRKLVREDLDEQREKIGEDLDPERLGRLEDMQTEDQGLSREMREEQKRVRRELNEQQEQVHKDLRERQDEMDRRRDDEPPA